MLTCLIIKPCESAVAKHTGVPSCISGILRKEELEATVQEVLGRLKSHQFFQSTWDTVAFIVFLTFMGTVLLLLLLVVAHCCCCSSPGPRRESPRKERPKGVDNLALEP
ncbi:small integral membrane protein 22 isoform X2 [Gorilla gorilla gorilla]|uniref:small integral membrane protein 22 isoform X2 n=1 Tax=Gorilla gorilla gorilla TaxID=9595 RepID=UPI002445E0AB|nr:small integral membrane protein 22 isoform X2 [Gorilla gorilla gorilla]